MTDSTPDPLWDGEGADAELQELQDLLAPYRAKAALPPLPRRARAPRLWPLAVAAILLLAVGGATFWAGLQTSDPPQLSPGTEPGLRGTTGAAVDPGTEGSSETHSPLGSRGPGRGSPTASDPDGAPQDPGADRGPDAQGHGATDGSPDGEGRPGSPTSALIYYEDDMARSANPVHERTMSDVRLNELIHLPLYAPNYADQPTPVLVDTEELDATGRVLTLTLKDRLWSDGEPVVAEDIVFTLAAYKNPASRSLDRHRWDFIVKAEAPDPTTLVLTFSRPFRAPPRDALYLKVLPKHAFAADAIPYAHASSASPVTAGPYVVAMKDHKTWVLQRNSLASQVGKIPEVRVQEVPEKRTQVELMSYGYGHAMVEVLPQQRAELAEDPCCVLKPYPLKTWWYTAMNQENRHLANPQVRAALGLAVDRQQSLDLIGDGELISGPFTLSSRYYNHEVPIPTPDRAQAEALMSKAGYAKEGSVWTLGGEPVTLRFFYDAALGDAAQTAATNLVGQLRTFGFDVSAPAAVPPGTWQERIEGEKDFDLVLGSWTYDRSEDLGQLFGSEGARNFVGFEDERVDALLASAYESADPSAQQAAMKELHLLLARTPPYLFLWSLRGYSALSRDLQGAHLQPYYYFTQQPDWSLGAP